MGQNSRTPFSDKAIARGQRLALVVEYNGASFSGWQLQDGVATVQGELERALEIVADAPVRVQCAGRTDAGVHATHQVIHFDTPSERSAKSWLMGCNAHLPETVVVRDARAVPQDFHARFSAESRRYRYLVYCNPVRCALSPRGLTWLRYPLEEEPMREAAQHLLGARDFSAFRAASCQSKTPLRRVDFIEVTRHGSLLVVDIQANAFLHHMVRNIVGSLLQVGRGRQAPDWLLHLLEGRDRTAAGDTAPPWGLYLVGVAYPESFGIPRLAPGPVYLAGAGAIP
jgi:tRNA pseudouridine38-40 synthase